MSGLPTVVVVGLGPAGPELVTPATTGALSRVPVRFVRTRRHPAATIVADARSFDDVYERAERLEEVYPAIVESLVGAAAEHGEVLYAVPGSPAVAERTVELLRGDDRVTLEILPAMSFLDLVWARLGVDPVTAGVRIVDGQRFAVDAAGSRGPLLVAQCDSVEVLSEVKLALDAGIEPCLDARAEVTVLHHLGLPDELVRTVPWTELDRVVEPDHLTSLWIPVLAAPVTGEVERCVELVATLRRECPWDREQTHTSLTRHLLEETYEVLDAIDALDPDAGTGYEHLAEELGDLLFQVLFHATLAAEAGQFTLADVARTVHDKLVVRHPHVFPPGGGERVAVSGPDDVVRNWERIKQTEKGRESIFDGIPNHLPALLYALKVQRKAATLADAGVEVAAPRPLDEAVSAAAERPDPATVGELLFSVVALAGRHGVDPEAALRAAAVHHRDTTRARETG